MRSKTKIMLAVACIGVLALAGCARERTVEAKREPASGVTIRDIRDNPDSYRNKTVTVSGEVDEVLSPRAFEIGGEGFAFPGSLLVIAKQDLPSIAGRTNGMLREDDIVQVTGTVRDFRREQIQREVGMQLSQDEYSKWEGQPVIVADSVQVTARSETRSEPGDPGRPMTPGTTPEDQQMQPGQPTSPDQTTQPKGTVPRPGKEKRP